MSRPFTELFRNIEHRRVPWRGPPAFVPHGGGVAGPPGVTLDLSFMSGSLDPRVTFTRASIGTYFDATGTVQTATTNVPRFDADPVTHAPLGLLIEEARANVLLNTATLGTQSVAVTAQAYTLSFYGTGTITKSGTATGALVGTGAFPTRVSQTFTPTAGTLTLTVTGSVLNAQLEAGSFVTSWIPTTAAAVTRAADVATIASIPGRNSAAETYQAEFLVVTPQHANPAVVGDNASTKNMLSFSYPGLQGQSWDGGNAVITATGMSLGAVAKIAATWTATTGTVCLNAGVVASGTQSLGYVSTATFKLMDDASGAGDATNGYIRRFRYWGRVLSNAELQAVTT